jgi:hypothetical protein
MAVSGGERKSPTIRAKNHRAKFDAQMATTGPRRKARAASPSRVATDAWEDSRGSYKRGLWTLQ